MQLFRDGLTEAFKLIANGDPLVMDAAWRSLWVSLVATGLGAIFGIIVGSILARKRIVGRSFLVLFFRAGMAVPTVLVGLIGYGLLSRQGLLGDWDLLYTSWAIVLGEFCLVVPILVTWTHGAMSQLDPRISETARMLGASPLRALANVSFRMPIRIGLGCPDRVRSLLHRIGNCHDGRRKHQVSHPNADDGDRLGNRARRICPRGRDGSDSLRHGRDCDAGDWLGRSI